MKKILSVFIVIGIIVCVVFYLGGKYPDKIKEYLMPEEPNGEILNQFESISKEEAMAYINDNGFVYSILNREQNDVLDVNKFITELPNQEKLFILPTGDNTFSKEQLVERALNTFGSADSIVNEDIICPYDSVALYKYDAATETYSYNVDHPGHGGSSIIVYNHFIDIKEENNTYILSVTRFYSDDLIDASDSKAYSNYKDYFNKTSNYLFDAYSIYGETLYDNYNQNFINYFEQNYDTFGDKLKIHKFALRKEDGVISTLSYEILE